MICKKLLILGIRGVPAAHGGFETFAEKLSLYLVAKGWSVTVYCQEEGEGGVYETTWNNVSRIHIPVKGDTASSTVLFDLKSVYHSCHREGLVLTLGYNTAIFNLLHRVYRRTNIINMDGIEWKRQKWGAVAKAWFWLNEKLGSWLGNHLVADHPEIKSHLSRNTSENKITMIPYGGDRVETAESEFLNRFGVRPYEFGVVIARPEPENSILEIVQGFASSGTLSDKKLLVLGSFSPEENPYHAEVISTANGHQNIIFPGAIYEAEIVNALRFFCRFYVHGHQVGGTNPSLVEALGASCAIVAHDNLFNRWVAEDGALYFHDVKQLVHCFESLFATDELWKKLKVSSLNNYIERFTWDTVLNEYEGLLARFLNVTTAENQSQETQKEVSQTRQ